MIILFGNQKGGVGKSTLSMLFANYLRQVKNRDVGIVDMDPQKSVYNKYRMSLNLNNNPLYKVEYANLKDYNTIHNSFKNGKEEDLIIDSGAQLHNDFIPLFQGVNLIICPFEYEEMSAFSTIEFADVAQQVAKEKRGSLDMVFVPNLVKANTKYETVDSVNNVLSQYGLISPKVSHRIAFTKLDTYQIPVTAFSETEPVFDFIFTKFFHK